METIGNSFGEQDGEAEKLLEEIEKLGEGSNPPYWFLPGKDEGERQFGWVLRNSQPAIALFSRLCDRLKRFVDRGASASVQPDSNASE